MARTDKELLTNIFALTILAAWTISFTVDLFVSKYEPHVALTPLMLLVAGWLFSSEFRNKGE